MIALLIVHGIGEQRRGETTAKLITGFKAAYGDAVDVGLDGDGYPNAVTANGRTVRLYECTGQSFCPELHGIDRRGQRVCVPDLEVFSHAACVRAKRWLRHGSGTRAQPGHGDRVSCVEWPRATCA